jgi:hypothetical protein
MDRTLKEKSNSTVFVVGAGFSAALGYPLSDSFFGQLFERADAELRERIDYFVQHSSFRFNLDAPDSYPNLEELLAEIMVLEHWAGAVRSQVRAEFSQEFLIALRRDILSTVTKWFFELQRKILKRMPDWLVMFVEWVKSHQASVISFNWDLVLDELLYGKSLSLHSYGFAIPSQIPALLKPHGSLNWYELERPPLPTDKCFRLCGELDDSIWVRQGLGSVHFARDVMGMPVIVPPAYLNSIGCSPFKDVGLGCIERLADADRVVFLGYSMPKADLHARSLLQWGLHNNAKGKSTPAEVIVVNSDDQAIHRTSTVVGHALAIPTGARTVEAWINQNLQEPVTSIKARGGRRSG